MIIWIDRELLLKYVTTFSESAERIPASKVVYGNALSYVGFAQVVAPHFMRGCGMDRATL